MINVLLKLNVANPCFNKCLSDSAQVRHQKYSVTTVQGLNSKRTELATWSLVVSRFHDWNKKVISVTFVFCIQVQTTTLTRNFFGICMYSKTLSVFWTHKSAIKWQFVWLLVSFLQTDSKYRETIFVVKWLFEISMVPW